MIFSSLLRNNVNIFYIILLTYLLIFDNPLCLLAISLEEAEAKAFSRNFEWKQLNLKLKIFKLEKKNKLFLQKKSRLKKMKQKLFHLEYLDKLYDLRFKIKKDIYQLYYQYFIYKKLNELAYQRFSIQKHQYEVKRDQFQEGRIHKRNLQKVYGDYLAQKKQVSKTLLQYKRNHLQFLFKINLKEDYQIDLNFSELIEKLTPIKKSLEFKLDFTQLIQKNKKIKIYKMKSRIAQIEYQYSIEQSKQHISKMNRKIKKYNQDIEKYEYMEQIQQLKESFLTRFLSMQDSYVNMTYEENKLKMMKNEKNKSSDKYIDGRISHYLYQQIENNYERQYLLFLLSILSYNISVYDYLYFLGIV